MPRCPRLPLEPGEVRDLGDTHTRRRSSDDPSNSSAIPVRRPATRWETYQPCPGRAVGCRSCGAPAPPHRTRRDLGTARARSQGGFDHRSAVFSKARRRARRPAGSEFAEIVAAMEDSARRRPSMERVQMLWLYRLIFTPLSAGRGHDARLALIITPPARPRSTRPSCMLAQNQAPSASSGGHRSASCTARSWPTLPCSAGSTA